MKKIILFLILLSGFFYQANADEKIQTILISFDGFRWDYLDRNLTPNIDSLIFHGVRAKSLKPVFPSKTFPNHFTIVSGMFPEKHGILQNDFIDEKTNRKYRISDSNEVTDARWYKGEAIWETAKRNGKISASYFWPGSEVKDEMRHPNYFEKYEHTRPYEDRINGVLSWLDLPIDVRPEIITLYFDLADTKGHSFGPNSNEVNSAISKLDSLIGKLVNGLRERKLFESTNIILVSDHGMTEVSLNKIIEVEKYLDEKNYLIQWNGPIMMINPPKEKVKSVSKILKDSLKNCNVYLKNEIPTKYNFSKNEMISEILIVANLGWSLSKKSLTKRDSSYFGGGNHGYDNHELEMHGIFVAEGPSFKNNFKSGKISNLDIYPLLCRILKIPPQKNIDGKLNRIEFLLK
ncbi:MAG: alkaline phosphatase family protein [Bacteroidota bacterium]